MDQSLEQVHTKKPRMEEAAATNAEGGIHADIPSLREGAGGEAEGNQHAATKRARSLDNEGSSRCYSGGIGARPTQQRPNAKGRRGEEQRTDAWRRELLARLHRPTEKRDSESVVEAIRRRIAAKSEARGAVAGAQSANWSGDPRSTATSSSQLGGKIRDTASEWKRGGKARIRVSLRGQSTRKFCTSAWRKRRPGSKP